MHYLVTYRFKAYGRDREIQYCTALTTDVEGEVASWQQHEDGSYVLINVHPVSEDFYNRWQGAMHGM